MKKKALLHPNAWWLEVWGSTLEIHETLQSDPYWDFERHLVARIMGDSTFRRKVVELYNQMPEGRRPRGYGTPRKERKEE